jgi:hypothetical protein
VIPHWQTVETLKSKVKRAEDHIQNLHRFWNSFAVAAYPWTAQDDSQSGYRIYRLTYAKPIPVDVPWMVGDAVHNLRSALDHLAFHLVSTFTNGNGPFKELYFPIAETFDKFNKSLIRASKCKSSSGAVVQRLRQEAIEAIKRIEPYETGKGRILYHIHKLDIIDKHHMLVVVGAMNPTHTMSPSAIARYRKSLGISADEIGPQAEAAAFMTDSIRVKFPLKAGDELHRVLLTEVNENMYFTFEVAFGEPKIVEGKPVVVTLYQAAKSIREIIREFDHAGLL